MAVLATRIWPSWRHTSLQPKGSRLDSPHARPKLGTDFRRRGFAGNRAPISGPVSWKSGSNFRRNCGPGGAAQNVRSTSRGADHVCRRKGCQHHVASTMCAYARDVEYIRRKRVFPTKHIFGQNHLKYQYNLTSKYIIFGCLCRSKAKCVLTLVG